MLVRAESAVKNPDAYEINNKNPEEKKRSIRSMFDAIVPTYDLLNHTLSFGLDLLWRNRMLRHMPELRGRRILDLCCGTGDLSLLLRSRGAEVKSLDFSLNMLKKGLEKKALGGNPVAADATRLPFQENSFDALTIAFGVRNIPNLDHFLMEAFRVLAPGGSLAILELVRPRNPLVRGMHLFYLGTLLPLIGGMVSGKKSAYDYLSATIRTFIDSGELQAMLEKYGFQGVAIFPQSFGIACIMIGNKKDRV